MQELGQRILILLGHSRYDETCQQFLLDTGPYQEYGDNYLDFPQHGFQLACRDNKIASVFFHIASKMVADGEFEQYSASLPGGIQTNDKREHIEKRLDILRKNSKIILCSKGEKCYWDEYLYGFFILTVCFHQKTEEMRFVSIDTGLESLASPTRSSPKRRRRIGRDRWTK